MKPLVCTLLLMAMITLSSCFRQATPPSKPFLPPFEVVDHIPDSGFRLSGGVYYMLPKSRVEIKIQVKKTDLIKGPYAQFAGKYLGIDNVINSTMTIWQIDEITVDTYAIPDTSQLHYVAMRDVDSSSIPVSFQLNFNNIGTLTGSSKMEDAILSESTSISAPGISYSNVFKFYAESNLFETIDTIVERVAKDSVMVEQTVLKKKMVEKPIEQRAKEAADVIQEIKEQRLRLLTGYQEIPYDPATIKYMAGELEKMEQDYIELFTGLKVETTFSRSFYFTPELADDCIPLAMARFSPQDGVLSLESNRGETMYVRFCSQGVAEAHKRHLVPDSLAQNKRLYTGFVYRVPEWASVTIYLGNKVQKEVNMPLPQFGKTARLPYFISRFKMDPETGAILNVVYP